MKSLRSIMVGACVLALPLSGFADLGPIVITPTRTEQARNNSSATVYVLDAENIETSGASTTSELLRGIPGVQIDDLYGNGTEVTVSVRGFSSTANANTLVLVNGRRLNYSDTAAPDLHHVFPKDIERIEVLVGSAGSLYGDQAVGGVINIITKKPVDSFHQISTRVGSFDYRGVDFSSSRRLTPSLAYRLSAGTFNADHYRDHNQEENTNFSGVLEYSEGANSLFFELQEIDNDLDLPGALIKPELEDDRTQINPGFINDFRNEDISLYRLGYERDLGEHRFSIDATHRKTDADILQSFRDFPSPEAGFDDRKNNSINPKLSGNLMASIDIPYVVGIDVEEVDYELEIPFDFFGPGVTKSSNEQDVKSLYFQINPMLKEALQLTFGMRASSVENDMSDGFSFPEGIDVDDDITVRELGLAYFIDDQTRVSVRLDENFRFAKVNELALAAPGDILDTQTGDSFEIGVDLTRGNHQLIASIYRLDLEDEIEFDPVNFINTNLDETRRDGLTLSLFSQLSTTFGFKTEIGIVDAEFRSGAFEGNDISGVSDTIASLRGDYRLNDYFTTYLEYNYSSPRYAQGDNANDAGKLGSITVFNAGIVYQFKAWDVNFRINNLADEEYEEFVTNNGSPLGPAYQPSPERNFMLTAGYSFE